MSREHFIPFRKTDIVAMCAGDLPAAERESFQAFAKMLASVLHHSFHERIEVLKDAYHPFNPEADTRAIATLSPQDRLAARRRLEEELEALAYSANFTLIDSAELDRAFTEHSLLKVRLSVNRDVVEKIMFFRRGGSMRSEQVKTWFGLRRKTIEFASYAKVLVYATFKDAEHFAGKDVSRLPFRPGSTIIKLFQNVPRRDLEMVLPNIQIRMRRIDKLLIGVPALISGIFVIVTKLFASFGVLLLLIAFWTGLSDKSPNLDRTALVTVGLGLAALGTYVVRQVSNFKNRKILFMKALSENLYFRNLDNDAGVFHHLLDAAEEADVTEAVLAYHFLRIAPQPLPVSELDALIEGWFVQHWDTHIDFEIEDGLRKLRELSLVSEDDEGRLSAVSLDEAQKRLDRLWDSLFDFSSRES